MKILNNYSSQYGPVKSIRVGGKNQKENRRM